MSTTFAKCLHYFAKSITELNDLPYELKIIENEYMDDVPCMYLHVQMKVLDENHYITIEIFPTHNYPFGPPTITVDEIRCIVIEKEWSPFFQGPRNLLNSVFLYLLEKDKYDLCIVNEESAAKRRKSHGPNGTKHIVLPSIKEEDS